MFVKQRNHRFSSQFEKQVEMFVASLSNTHFDSARVLSNLSLIIFQVKLKSETDPSDLLCISELLTAGPQPVLDRKDLWRQMVLKWL